MINVAYVRQGEPLGLGHAVLVTADLVGDEPFAVILADDVIDATPPALKQMIDVFEKVGGPVLAVERVPADQVSNYGIVDVDTSVNLGKGIHARAGPRRKTGARRSAVESRDHRPLSADARHLSGAARNRERSRPEKFSSPTACASCFSSGRSSRTRSKASATTRATSSATCRRWCTSRCRRPDLNEPFRAYLRSENIERRSTFRNGK